MQKFKLVCIGGGVAAGYLVQTLLDEGFEPAEICVLSADERPPYERPPLSKGIMVGEEEFDDIWINEPNYYTEHGVTVELNTHVHNIDTKQKHVFSDLGAIEYEYLVIATGAQPKRLDVSGAAHPAIHYLRFAEDAQRIREAASQVKSAVVIGGSFIGMEVASSLRQNDLDVSLVFPEERVWQAIFTPAMSDFFEKYYQKNGVDIYSGVTVTGFKELDSGLRVVLDNGSHLVTDLVVAGVGVTPSTEPFADSGMKISDGIVTDEFLETNIKDVFAIGDVANYFDTRTDSQRRVEHWDNAVQQAKTVAKTLAGERTAFDYVPYFFSDVFDLSYEIWGRFDKYDNVVYWGDLDSGQFSAWWLHKGKVQAAFVMGRSDEEREQAQQWVDEEAEISPADLESADIA